MIAAAALLLKTRPDLRFVAAMANPAVASIFRKAMTSHPATDIQLVEGRARDVITSANTVVCASGTVTLETLLINRPMVSVYRVAPATYHLAKSFKLIKRQFFALPNILAGEALIPELIQDEVSPERIAGETLRWLNEDSLRQHLGERFEAMHDQLRCNASEQAAAAISRLLDAAA
jgi:lipid-A-disaccharide synthase